MSADPGFEERQKRRYLTRGMKVDGLSFKMASLKVGEKLFLDAATQKDLNRLSDRAALSGKVTALAKEGLQFECRRLICRDLFDPEIITFILRIERLVDQPRGTT